MWYTFLRIKLAGILHVSFVRRIGGNDTLCFPRVWVRLFASPRGRNAMLPKPLDQAANPHR